MNCCLSLSLSLSAAALVHPNSCVPLPHPLLKKKPHFCWTLQKVSFFLDMKILFLCVSHKPSATQNIFHMRNMSNLVLEVFKYLLLPPGR